MDQTILLRLHTVIEKELGNRFHGIVLFGSEARDESLPDSDIDLLVLLEKPILLGRDLEIIIKATYPLQLEIERQLHFLIANYQEYASGATIIYRNIRKEGIPVGK